MKNTILIIIIFTVISGGLYFNNLIDKKSEATTEYELKNLTKQNVLKGKIDSLKIIKDIVDSLDNKMNLLIKEKNDVIITYQSHSKWVEKMNKQYMESIDMNKDGIPDNVERGDYDNDGIPDYIR